MECANVQEFSDIAGLVNLPIVLLVYCLDLRFVHHNRGICLVSNVSDDVKSVAELRDNPLPTRNRVTRQEDANAKDILLTCSPATFCSYVAINVFS